LRICRVGPQEFSVVPMCGSATHAMESVLRTMIQPKDKVGTFSSFLE